MGSPISIVSQIGSVVEGSENVSARVLHAIQSASTKTGVNFSYLMQKASQESSFDPAAKSTSSTATGLFQFTSGTWLHMIKEYGAKYGLGDYAAHITENSDGSLSIDSPAMRQAILALRKDPIVSAEMAGELDKENAAALQKKVGGTIGATELYLAHFLGAGGASKFIRNMRSNPQMAAADLMPSAASANRNVFYDKSGNARSLQQIYNHFAQKFDDKGTRMASATAKTLVTQTPSFSYKENIEKLASAFPTFNAASAQTNKSISIDIGDNFTSTGNTSLIDAMIFAQSRLDTDRMLMGRDQYADNKKKNAYMTAAALS